ncbi:MAG: hypothetical protein ACWA5T_10450 [Parvularcula sp.]
MLINPSILIAAGAVFILLLLPRVRTATTWRAMVTPLASIIGSGFLVLGPILSVEYGRFAPAVMAGLCAVAYLFGWSIRYNIAMPAQDEGIRRQIDRASEWVLGFAYMISVAYYLNLFGAFAVSLTPYDGHIAANGVTTCALGVILIVGWTRGFRSLERMEYFSVALKLAIIAGLLLGLTIFFTGHAAHGSLVLSPPRTTGWPALTLALGLIITVQGFETSRYLGNEYSAPTRITSMRKAQWVTTLIYMVYAVLFTYSLTAPRNGLTETTIIGMTQSVATILPVMLVIAALAAQFSAAIADTSGSGGLINELSKKKISTRSAYAILTAAAIFLTWTIDIFGIISFASRAFALYYAFQGMLAAVTAWQQGQKARSAAFSVLCLLALFIVAFGRSVEGHS